MVVVGHRLGQGQGRSGGRSILTAGPAMKRVTQALDGIHLRVVDGLFGILERRCECRDTMLKAVMRRHSRLGDLVV